MSLSNSITSPPPKILLTSSTKISLHDRFTNLEKARPSPSSPNGHQNNNNNNNDSDSGEMSTASMRASAKNRRLALQMANRPSVQAALKLKNKSIRQRIGVSSASNNNNGSRSNNNNQQQSSLRRDNFSNPPRRSTSASRSQPQQRSLRTNDSRQPISSSRSSLKSSSQLSNSTSNKKERDLVTGAANLRSRLSGIRGETLLDPSRLSGVKIIGIPSNRPNLVRRSAPGNLNRGGLIGGRRGGARSLNNSLNTSLSARGGINKRALNQRGRLSAGNGRGAIARNNNGTQKRGQLVRTNIRGGIRGGRGARGGREGATSRGGGSQPNKTAGEPKSRENLDMDLDQYMSKSRSHLDNDLDTYMAQSSA